ncbi:sulfatase-like hydrolase/transferase [Flammeovirga sp. SJP92]|uniref:sulfatase-like hydrolase/transferase n=1 Tax=Flammeovirga sp. SJP92 TaxID=1775430 RepID=UPI0009EF4486|nr:sulfatase-like hydrolase/transferase [Flammeovirga sp. SJP92]
MKQLIFIVLMCFTTTISMGQDKPNIVIMMTDNQGYGDMGCYGGLRVPTPHMDKLAESGIQFLDFQIDASCTASRASFMTARMPIRSGTSGYVIPGEPGGLHPMEVTIAEMLKSVGYSTANYGKWHLGETADRQPQNQGFDEWYGVANSSFPVDSSFPGYQEDLIPPQGILSAKAGEEAKVVADMTLEKRGLIDSELTAKSVDYIKKHANKKEPFFLLTTFINPHHPVVPHPNFAGKSKGGAYTDVLMEIDYNVSQIVGAIDDAGIRENTIIIFFSDNGPTRYSPEADHNGDPGPWAGELGSGWEGGLRTVGMMSWPNKIRSNWKSEEMFHAMDFMPTLANIVGAEMPDDRPIDGFDQTDFLLGKQEHSNRDHRLVYYYGDLTVVRWAQYKAHFVKFSKFQSCIAPPIKLGQIPEFYNLKTDPKELFNLYGRSGGIPLFFKFQEAMIPYFESMKEYPNLDYSKMKRDK